MTREEYVKFLEGMRPKKGEAWYNARVAEMRARDVHRQEAWRAAELKWREQIDSWGVGGGFEKAMDGLGLGTYAPGSGERRRYKVGTVTLEINYRKQTCTRWDGKTFINNKKGRSGVLGLVTSVFELQGAAKPYQEAVAFLSKVSGIERDAVSASRGELARLEENRIRIAQAAAARAAEDRVEKPIGGRDAEVTPRTISDPKQIKELTELMAKERGFPPEYAKRMVDEGSIHFGTFRYRDDSGRVVDTGRPVAASEIRGITSGALVGYSSREFRQFYHGPAKGKNVGAITRGVGIIGNWSETTRRVTLCEGGYSAHALRLLREGAGRPLAPNEAILFFGGSRVPNDLLAECKKRGAEVISAFDNDIGGRAMAAAVAKYCGENGIKFETHLPQNGEVTLALDNSEKGKAALAELAAALGASGQRFVMLPQSAAKIGLVAETSDATCEALSKMKQALDLDRVGAEPKQAGSPPLMIFHRKDWNDLVQGDYRAQLSLNSAINALAESQEQLGRQSTADTAAGSVRAPNGAEAANNPAKEAIRAVPAPLEAQKAAGLGTDAANGTAGKAAFDTQELVGGLQAIRARWLLASNGKRADIALEGTALVDAIGGPGVTAIPLRAEAKEYIEADGPLGRLFMRADEHAAACRGIVTLGKGKQCGLGR
jgi:hypothetical protein